MSRQGRFQCHLCGFAVANLADEHDIRVRPQDGPGRRRDIQPEAPIHLDRDRNAALALDGTSSTAAAMAATITNASAPNHQYRRRRRFGWRARSAWSTSSGILSETRNLARSGSDFPTWNTQRGSCLTTDAYLRHSWS
jgi:hypothetical protein